MQYHECYIVLNTPPPPKKKKTATEIKPWKNYLWILNSHPMKLQNEKFHTPQKTLFILKFQSSPWAKKQTKGIVNTFACPIMLYGDRFSL